MEAGARAARQLGTGVPWIAGNDSNGVRAIRDTLASHPVTPGNR